MTKTRVALVTGSGKRRVGWHVAAALAQRGYSLALHYHTSAEEAQCSIDYFRELGVQVDAFPADLADDQAVRVLVERALATFGTIDVLVNCAAVWQRKRLEDVTAADVRRHFEVNALGTFLCCQHAGLAMVKQPEGGCIVNLSDWAVARPYLNYGAYFPSKGAVTALTRSLAVELASRNPRVRVNCVLPGPVMLPADLPEQEKRQAIEATLVKHEGSPQNVAQAVLALIDNDFITGVCLPVDGGRTIYAPE
jgi:pteridine reductase